MEEIFLFLMPILSHAPRQFGHLDHLRLLSFLEEVGHISVICVCIWQQLMPFIPLVDSYFVFTHTIDPKAPERPY